MIDIRTKKDIKEFLISKPGYQKFGKYALAKALNLDSIVECEEALRELRFELKNVSKEDVKAAKKDSLSHKDVFINAFMKDVIIKTPQLEVRQSKSGKNVLVIGDLHTPFCLEGYLSHCKEMYVRYRCNEVVFIGDIIDNHASSYHETDPDGHSAGQELKLAIQQVSEWYTAFPKASVIIGNHDRLIMRKAYSSGLSRMWIKDYADVLGTPGWKFVESVEIDNVLYIHGEGGTARSRARRDLQSIVQGHLHSQAYIEWIVGSKFKIFGMQVGCGVNHKSYAMAYGKEGPKPAIACGVVLQGLTPINCMMEL
jgi:metallophosphoesterase superfamily enzyme